jgi:hypothetical protein
MNHPRARRAIRAERVNEMKRVYFADCWTVEQIKIRYRELAIEHHPDHGGDTRTMQDINAEYHIALKMQDGRESTDDGKKYTYKYDEQTEQNIMDKISELLKIKMNAEIALIGVWIWITGDTRPVKTKLKDIGCKWHQKRAAWYWSPYKHYGKSSRGSLEHLACKYGCETFTSRNSDLATV